MSRALRPIVHRRRCRSTLTVALIASAMVTALVLAGLQVFVVALDGGDPRIDPRAVIVATPPHDRAIVVPMPMALVFDLTAPAARSECPAEVTEVPPGTLAPLPESVDRVRPAPSNAQWIATWNAQHIYVSTDAGASFARVLDGPGEVRDVTFDCFGHVFALRGEQFGARANGRELWRAFLAPAAWLVGGGPDAIVVGRADTIDNPQNRIAISGDLGATWRYLELRGDFEGGRVSGRQDARGVIRIAAAIPDCMDDMLDAVTVRGDTVAEDRTDISESAAFARYGDLEVAGDSVRHTGTGAWQPIEGLPPATDPPERSTPLEGPYPVIARGAQLLRIVRGVARALPVEAVGAAQAVDLAGRVWCIDGGQLALARYAAIVSRNVRAWVAQALPVSSSR